MFGLSTLYTRLIGAGAILLLVLAGWVYVSHLQTKVETLTSSLEVEKGRYALLSTEFDRATKAKTELDLSLKQAEARRAALVKSYDARLKKSRVKVPVKETACPAVIDWAISQKGDLAW